jgi:hypothetical protein
LFRCLCVEYQASTVGADIPLHKESGLNTCLHTARRVTALIALALAVLGLTACASITHGDQQRLRVEATCGDRAVPAQCSATNDRGRWQFEAPASLVVTRDASLLRVSCSSPFFGAQTLLVPPHLSRAMAGNVLAGGLVGAGVDVVTGSGLAYPAVVMVNYPSCR